uniref:Uncharacterized protein n=1 Tax=Gastroclonium compressum TaxID=1852973 RepID=A0A173FZS6_GASCM|nr:hypothetical protein [Coeloseira compressa]ANH09532.1 hypothetical protein [Coeloseira compressa]
MNITYIYNKNICILNKGLCLSLKIHQSRDIWLINCAEGSQNYCIKSKTKINRIYGIIITSLHINHIAGIIGFLSTLSLINRTNNLYIYAPKGINKYLKLIKRYAKTNFKYKIYFLVLRTNAILNIKNNIIYFGINQQKNYALVFLNYEQYNHFNLKKAKIFRVSPGPIYNNLKKCSNMLLPDGLILNGHQFITMYENGKKITITSTKHHIRPFYEFNWKNNFCYSEH